VFIVVTSIPIYNTIQRERKRKKEQQTQDNFNA
jgi:hypothetical protein